MKSLLIAGLLSIFVGSSLASTSIEPGFFVLQDGVMRVCLVRPLTKKEIEARKNDLAMACFKIDVEDREDCVGDNTSGVVLCPEDAI